MKTIDGMLPPRIRILVHLFADSLNKIAHGRGIWKGADNGHLPTANGLISPARFDRSMQP
jgi:hypothetical protein